MSGGIARLARTPRGGEDRAERAAAPGAANLAADLGRLVLRLVTGGLLAGHGAQKLLGAFDGPGLQGTERMLESLGIHPARMWAPLAGLAELGGGVLTALGLMSPIGPLATLGSMTLATVRAHGGKPIWATKGGAELPVTNIAIALDLALAGPGRFSLDRALGIRVSRTTAALAVAATAAGIFLALAPPAMLVDAERARDEQAEGAERRLREAARA
jgi:putative oxidoreductase